ncbi:LysR family transcriptional regulator [Mariluticola halotolerans]|uniref:LysR family transcriptional regulator n=1 Tax=Mariluticola halotolerans TaxID=2909283 RepID=UPI0026E229A6|nr:LysR family transcriptional regulator [Mariluticola halotolerans]UJQ93792.1 LysR family transcriptional regulator [Mariluticola halotolerans]
MSNTQPDWALWRSFAAVVEQGSLSAAARALGLSQPTLGRHIEALEHHLGSALFERTLTGLRPNDTALRLYEHVQVANKALAEAIMVADGANAELAGTVRITASVITSHYTLPQILVQLREEFPAISIDLVPSDSPENLLIREADIAVRMFRPTQLELITRKIGESAIMCCAHQSYLDRRSTPSRFEDLHDHDLIGFDRSDLLISAARALGATLSRDDFCLRSDSQSAIWELAKAGLGISFGQKILIESTPGMVALMPELDIPPLEVWLTTHRELFTSRRIRVIYDRLGALLGAYYAAEKT